MKVDKKNTYMHVFALAKCTKMFSCRHCIHEDLTLMQLLASGKLA